MTRTTLRTWCGAPRWPSPSPACSPSRCCTADNGSTLKATTVLSMLYWLGVKPSYSRPRVSDDNAYAPVPVPYRQVPPGVPRQGLRRARRGTRLGGRVCALVQPRASSQRHPLRHAPAAPQRAGSSHPGRSARAVPQGTRTQSGALVGCHPKLVADRARHPQPRTRQCGQGAGRGRQQRGQGSMTGTTKGNAPCPQLWGPSHRHRAQFGAGFELNGDEKMTLATGVWTTSFCCPYARRQLPGSGGQLGNRRSRLPTGSSCGQPSCPRRARATTTLARLVFDFTERVIQ